MNAVPSQTDEIPRENKALERPLQVFRAHQDEFAIEHHGQFVVIHGDDILGFFENELEAYQVAKSQYEMGTFLLRQCLRPDEEVNPIFHSRVA